MFSNRLALAALGAACIAAAGVGGYIAARQSTSPAPLAAAAQQPTPAAATTSDRPVTETEAVVGDAPKPTPQVTDPAPVPAPLKTGAAPAKSGPSPRPATKTASARSHSTPVLDHSWPSNSGTSSQAQSAPAMPPSAPGTLIPSDGSSLPQVTQETPRPPEPLQKTYEELVVSADSVIGLQTENTISSERAKVEDRVEARVTRDVRVGDRVAIPAGSRALGSVTQVERGGKFKERARLGVRFHTIVFADGTRLPISTDTLYRDGAAPGTESAAKIGGGAVGGAILGAILGGAKGAVIGATTGGAAGAGVVAAGDRNAATLPAGSPVTVRLMAPVTVTVEK